jgi:hypothetical protein
MLRHLAIALFDFLHQFGEGIARFVRRGRLRPFAVLRGRIFESRQRRASIFSRAREMASWSMT